MSEDAELLALRAERDRLLRERETISSSEDPELLALKAERDSLLKNSRKTPEEGMLSRTVRNVARGFKDIPVGAFSTLDFIATPIRGAMNYGNKLLGGDEDYFTPVSENLDRGIDNLTGGYTKPRNLTERIGSESAKALSSFIPSRAIGLKALEAAPSLGSKASKFFKGTGNLLAGGTDPTLTNLGATGAGIAVREKTLEDNPDSHGSAFVNELATNLATRGASSLTKIAKPESAKKIAKIIKFNPEKYKDFQEAGISSTLADVSDSVPLKWTENGLRKTPFAGHFIDDVKNSQKKKATEILGQHVDSDLLTQGHGGKLVGEAAKTGFDKYNKISKKLYDSVESISENNSKVPLKTPSTNKFLNKLWKESESSKGSEDLFKQSAIGKAAEDFENLHIDKHGNPKTVTYKELTNFMKSWDEKVKTFGIHGGKKDGPLKLLDSYIRQDIGNYFKNIGPEAEETWKRANRYSKKYLTHEKKFYNPIKQHIDQNEEIKAFNFVKPTEGSVKKATYVMHHLGDKAPEYWSTLVNKWGTKKDIFEPMRAVNKFKSLDKTLQYKLLDAAKYDDSQKRIFRNNIKALSHIENTLAENQTSGTAPAQNLKEYIERWGRAITGVASASAGASASYLSGSLTPLAIPISYGVAARSAAKAFINPKLQNWLNKGVTAKSDKMVPKWLEYGLKIPGIPTSVKEEMKEVYSNILKSEKATNTGNTSKAIFAAIQGRMNRSDDK